MTDKMSNNLLIQQITLKRGNKQADHNPLLNEAKIRRSGTSIVATITKLLEVLQWRLGDYVEFYDPAHLTPEEIADLISKDSVIVRHVKHGR